MAEELLSTKKGCAQLFIGCWDTLALKYKSKNRDDKDTSFYIDLLSSAIHKESYNVMIIIKEKILVDKILYDKINHLDKSIIGYVDINYIQNPKYKDGLVGTIMPIFNKILNEENIDIYGKNICTILNIIQKFSTFE
jgi:hypothetical protein